ncbi:ABC transporter substrate-binding protein [Nitriliruptor alkaliphilus]|uniref:ABC transporter substrate-binding protein n=1 Tax=Nitriliruptor alkaliphilus TaxID=427918 RepID=UPI00147032DA|nr:ABC transporter substrate-binding protein [Nitriliruptor alkaliphilus]
MVRDKRLGWRLIAATSALAMVAAACNGTDDDGVTVDDDGEETAAPEGDPENYCEGSTETDLVWAHEQEPPDLHLDDPANNLSIASWIQQGMLEGLYGITSDILFVPELLEDEAEVTENEDGSVTVDFTLREGIQFSDGEPITGQTIKDNFDLYMDEAFALSTRGDYETIDPDSWEIDGQNFSYTMPEFFAGWPSLFARVLPTHAIGTEGEAANEAMREFMVDGEPLPASGPLQFSSWNRGVDMTLVRNDEYHGSNPLNDDVTNQGIACITGVTLQFVTETDAQINAVRSGEADFIFTQPQVPFGEGLADDPNVTAASGPSAAFEHWSMNIHNPHLNDADVREALAYAIDKGVVMESLYEPLYGDVLPLEGLGATYWLTGEYYQDLQGEQGYGQGDFDSANELLEGAGYELNADNVWEHPERGPLTLRVSTTGGNQLRELQQQLLQDQLSEGGWDIQIDNLPGADHFSQQSFSPGNVACSVSGGDDGATVTLASGDEATADCGVVDIVQFAWVGGPWPGGQSVAFKTGSENNPHGYSNTDLDALLDTCDQTIDDDERAACYTDADRYVTTRTVDEDGLIIIPLTTKPNFFAFSDLNLQQGATAVDANDAGPLVHAVDYLPH